MINRDYYYTAAFDIGTPGQTRHLLVDTGSSWLWTWADDCPNPEIFSCEFDSVDILSPPRERFHPNLSETFRYTGDEKLIEYGVGESSGPVATDFVRMTELPQVYASNFEFFVQMDVGSGKTDGIIGFAPRDESSGPLLVEYLYAQQTIPEQQFAVLMGHDQTEPSSLTLGGYDREGGEMYDSKYQAFTVHRV